MAQESAQEVHVQYIYKWPGGGPLRRRRRFICELPARRGGHARRRLRAAFLVVQIGAGGGAERALFGTYFIIRLRLLRFDISGPWVIHRLPHDADGGPGSTPIRELSINSTRGALTTEFATHPHLRT